MFSRLRKGGDDDPICACTITSPSLLTEQTLECRVFASNQSLGACRTTFVELMSAVVSQLQGRFVPAVPDVKLNIDRLIDKEYIARDPDQMDVFVYVS